MREFRGWVKFSLFLSAYIPFYLIMAVQNLDLTIRIFDTIVPWVAGLFSVLIILSGFTLWKTVNLRKKEEPHPKSVESYQRRNDLLAGYLIAYVFPFVNLNYSQWENWFALLIFFIVLAAIQLRSDQLHINPVLAVFGYDVYEVDDPERDSQDIVLAHKSVDMESGEHIDAVQISSNVFITS